MLSGIFKKNEEVKKERHILTDVAFQTVDKDLGIPPRIFL